MRVKVELLPDGRVDEIEVPAGSTINDVLGRMGLRPDMFIVIRGKVPVPEDDAVVDDDRLRIIRVASGG